jgi:ribosomal protein S18 acetylase RimI-like enzyme
MLHRLSSSVAYTMQIRPYLESDELAVISLWRACELTRPWNDPKKDIERKLKVQRQLFLVGEIEGQVIASVMAGYDGHRGWINYLAVHPDFQRRRIGSDLMEAAQILLFEMGCPKINLQVRLTNESAVGFYKSIGYAQDEVVSFGKRIIPDNAA